MKVRDQNLIFKTIVGSQAYGTSTPASDIDFKGVYVQSIDDILSFRYNEQIEIGKDECYYEVRRFLQLAQSANPNILEMLFMHDEGIVYSAPAWNLIRNHKEKFLTKKCCQSFGGYAVAQIRKARGLDKKMNWEKSRVERKTPLDFCYLYQNGQSVAITKYLRDEGMEQELCGLVALDHMRDCYAIYYDWSKHYADQKRNDKSFEGFNFKGIIHENSNELLLSSVPKYATPLCLLYYNKDGYSMHCKDYREYTEWLEKRNTQRFVDTAHGQQIDGKNLLHCRRLLDMAIEIAKTGTLNVKRPNAEYLLQIRRGEVALDSIIDQAEKDIEELDKLYDESDLPTTVEMDFINDLLLEVRHLEKEYDRL